MEGKEEAGFVKWFSELSSKSVAEAGGKGASLAEMYNSKFPVPPGFVVTTGAYSYFLEKAGLKERIGLILKDLDVEDTKKLEKESARVREIIEKAKIPDELEKEIEEAYDILDAGKSKVENARKGALDILKNSKEGSFVAVRSSATTEDLVDASFAGQQETFLNVKGYKNLIESVKKCFASLFTARAVYYRTKKGFSHEKSQLAAVVQKMIDSDKSGVIFSRNPVSKKDSIVIEAVFGLGEGIVSGRIKPDNYEINSDIEKFEIIDIKVAEKKAAIVRNSSGETIEVKLNEEKSKQQVLDNYELKTLARYAKKLEEHYKKPQDIEFAIENDEIYIVQSRPITTSFSDEKKREDISGKVLVSGLPASPGIASGIVKVIKNLNELNKIRKGDVLVTEMTNPDMVVTMQKAAAIVTDEGGVTSHASIVSREMGIPAVVGTGNATSILEDGMEITIDGFSGRVYLGKGEAKEVEINPIVKTKTKIKVIVDLPGFAERAALSGVKEIGLVRLEGIIALSGKHPLYFSEDKKLNEYISLLYNGLKKIAEHFDEIWIRTSDIRSDEFKHLQGAPEEAEGNPMLGNHGIRFSLKHKEILGAELEAVKKTALDLENKKIGIMMPQIISVNEFLETKKLGQELKMPGNVKYGVMIETPAAVQIISELCESGIEFASFGTNDLTQFMLAIDRNNKDIQDLYNEMNPAVLSAISYVIRKCKKYGVETSICGQAGSKEEMASFLVKEGIDSISVNADAAEKVSKIVAKIEKEISNVKNNDVDNKDRIKKDYRINNMKKVDLKPSDIYVKKEIKVPVAVARNSGENRDIEEILLRELDADEYYPGDPLQRSKDVPLVNEDVSKKEDDNLEALRELFR